MRNRGTLIGHVDVDSGSIWIGDPCYLVKDDEEWHKLSNLYCDALHEGASHVNVPHQPGHAGKGIMSSTLYGDGAYPVYAEFRSDGRIKSLTINFEDEEDEEDGNGDD